MSKEFDKFNEDINHQLTVRYASNHSVVFGKKNRTVIKVAWSNARRKKEYRECFRQKLSTQQFICSKDILKN